VFSLPLAYAKLPFRGVPGTVDLNQILKLTVNALTPDGEQIGCLGVRRVDTTTSLQPSLNINVGGFGLGLSGLGCSDRLTREDHQHIELIRCCGFLNTRSYWEFRNDQHARYPWRVFLLIEFSSNHGTDEPFPFVLHLNRNCKVKLSRGWIKGGNKFVGQPAQDLDIMIKGNWRRNEVLKHRESADTGIVAALERLTQEVSDRHTYVFAFQTQVMEWMIHYSMMMASIRKSQRPRYAQTGFISKSQSGTV
jgi:hypothetical protein